ncbi:MAG: DNA adenine methylase [Paenibacillus dendritiformis]|uniref:DNA adenine methylase n=1 Tax=uncultured Paenibacillus sp. TaxID=227322 RepID=UPI0025E3A11F|nr:DNA adenine methylase [uncultured Paenibacillus sp.]MDU5143668.1 DNA adenine methylase [Paenibacillus dendritiformis]
MHMQDEIFTRSPLRFPGSKSKVINKLRPFFSFPHKEYREPFVGGGAIFFAKQKAPINWLNDKDENVSNFLQVIKNNPFELCELVNSIAPTVEIWQKFRGERQQENVDPIQKAFRFLFFNRTNYSGIYNANPIGGLKQKSQYKISCRWNSEMLCKRIIECAKKLRDSKITNYDFKQVILKEGEDVFLMVDPPYYEKGSSLYPVFMSPDDHKELAYLLMNSPHYFLLTIDDCEEVREMYSWANIILPQNWFYTVNSKKKDNVGKELFVTNLPI